MQNDHDSPSHQANGSQNEQVPGQHDLLPRDVLQNYDVRAKVDLARFTGMPVQIAFDQSHPLNMNRSTMDDDVQIGLAIGNGIGIIGGWLLTLLCIRFHWFQTHKSLNPLYRSFKTLACTGLVVGMLLANLIPLPSSGRKFLTPIISDVCCIFFGIFAIPYWLVRQYILRINPEVNETYSKLGVEGWSKYNKMFLVWATSLGQFTGYIYSLVVRAPLSASMNIAGGIVGAAAVALGFIMVPAINKISELLGYGKILQLNSNDKHRFSTNYVRSGITLGTALGFVLGGPVGSAIGGVLGGLLLGVTGHRITSYIQRNWLAATTETENRWDYPTRTTSFAGASFGCLIGFFLPIPGGALLGSALGGAIGWFAGLPAVWLPRKIQPVEEKSTTLPWSQRVATEVNRFAMIGMIIGAVIGFVAGGPGGAVAGGTLGGAIGGVIGTIRGVLYGKEARAVMKKVIFPEPPPPPPQAPEVAPVLTPTPSPTPQPAPTPIAPVVAATAGAVAGTAALITMMPGWIPASIATAPAVASIIAAAPIVATAAATVAVVAATRSLLSSAKTEEKSAPVVEVPEEKIREIAVIEEPDVEQSARVNKCYNMKLPSLSQFSMFSKPTLNPKPVGNNLQNVSPTEPRAKAFNRTNTLI